MTSLEKQILKLNQKYIEMFISEIMNSKNGGNDITEDTLKDMWKNISSSSGKQPKKKGTRKSGYTVFLVEQRPTIASENPNLKSTEVISIVAKKWRELSDDQKAIYINKAKNPSSGKYIDGEEIKSIALGAFKFLSIIVSNPFPIDVVKKTDGIIPNKVDQK